jgi:hypothetical protein
MSQYVEMFAADEFSDYLLSDSRQRREIKKYNFGICLDDY